MSLIDEIVASVVKAAYHRGVINNTVILFLSLPDNNETALESNVRRTAFVYSPLLKIQQSVSNQMIHLIDLLPTLVNASNLKWHTKDIISMDGVDQWSTLNDNDEKRTEIYGENFFIRNNWKLTYGDKKTISYGSLANENMEGDQDMAAFNLEAYVKAVMQSEVHLVLNKLNPKIISVSKNRAKVHCHLQDVEENNVNDIKCSRSDPCLFDLLKDPCELDNKFEQEFYLRRQHMKEILEKYLQDGKIENISSKSFATEDPNSSMEDGTIVGIILGGIISLCILAFIIVVCVKEKCNQKRSVYYDKSKEKTKNTESNARTEPSSKSSSNENPISVISHNAA